jgi:hypothetical protein
MTSVVYPQTRYSPIGCLDQFMELVSGTTTSSTLVDRPYLAAVLGSVWQCLPLARPAKRIGRFTVFLVWAVRRRNALQRLI